jgi:hypothetical protein
MIVVVSRLSGASVGATTKLDRREWHDLISHLADLISIRFADLEDGARSVAE